MFADRPVWLAEWWGSWLIASEAEQRLSHHLSHDLFNQHKRRENRLSTKYSPNQLDPIPQISHVYPMSDCCWASVCDAGPTAIWRWVSVCVSSAAQSGLHMCASSQGTAASLRARHLFCLSIHNTHFEDLYTPDFHDVAYGRCTPDAYKPTTGLFLHLKKMNLYNNQFSTLKKLKSCYKSSQFTVTYIYRPYITNAEVSV